MNRVIHFEISTDVPKRAIKFYKNIFGWEIESWGGPENYWLIKTGENGTPGIDGGLIKREKPLTGDQNAAYICTIGVSNIDDAVVKVKQNGGKVLKDKMEIPGIGWYAPCQDTERNNFGVLEPRGSSP